MNSEVRNKTAGEPVRNAVSGMKMRERIRQIAGTDKQIDELVYELHGLTEVEIGVAERGEK